MTSGEKCDTLLQMERVKADTNLVNLTEASRLIGVNYSTLWRWIKKGRVSPVRVLGLPYLTLEQIQALKKIDNEENK